MVFCTIHLFRDLFRNRCRNVKLKLSIVNQYFVSSKYQFIDILVLLELL